MMLLLPLMDGLSGAIMIIPSKQFETRGSATLKKSSLPYSIFHDKQEFIVTGA
jgi:hypothetical protein